LLEIRRVLFGITVRVGDKDVVTKPGSEQALEQSLPQPIQH